VGTKIYVMFVMLVWQVDKLEMRVAR